MAMHVSKFLALAITVSFGASCAIEDHGPTLGESSFAVAVSWTSAVNVTPNGPSIRKTSGADNAWNAGAISIQSLTGDGFVQFTTSENTTNKFAGLSNGNTNTDYADIDYAFYLLASGSARVYEKGVLRATVGTYSAGDSFRIETAGGQVRYYLRGTLVYTSTDTPTFPLIVDTALYSTNATITDAQIGTDGSAPGWANAVGVTTTLDTLTKTAGTGWNAGASSLATLSSDGYVQFATGEATTNKFIGLSNGDLTRNYTEIDYAFYLMASGSLRVYENGVLRKIVGTYSASDVFRVELIGSEVRYVVNGILVYRSATTPQLPLILDTSFYDTGATIRDVVIGSSISNPAWENPVGVTFTNNSLTKTAGVGWNAGAATAKRLFGAGHVTFTTGETTTNKFAGLSNGNTNAGYEEIDYAFYLMSTGSLRIYENGVLIRIVGTYAAGDTFDIGIVGGEVQYSVNGTVVYTSTVAPSLPLALDTSLYDTGATIQGVTITP